MIIFKRRTYLNQLLVDCYLKEVIVDGLYFEITIFFIFSKIIFEPEKFNEKKQQQHTVIASEFNYLENKDHDVQRMKNAMRLSKPH